MINKDTQLQSTKHFKIIPVQNNEYGYDYLILFLSHNAPSVLLQKEIKFDKTVNGKLLLDRVLHVGNNDDRYVSYDICNGEINLESIQPQIFARKHYLRRLSNAHYKTHPDLIQNSILNDSQKKLLLKGLSI